MSPQLSCASPARRTAPPIGSDAGASALAVAPAPEPVKPVTISPDDALNKSLADAAKDFSAVKVSAMNGIVSIAGNLSKKDWMKLKQAIDKMTPKGYDLKALKIN